ncbi:metallophosphoesterase family protein [Thermodesulfovibrio hydrogeniphilus]
MRVLHTSDWHLGKNLENFSRIDEQDRFLEDFVQIVDENDVDLVIIAGDVYDSSNPSAKAESLLYSTLKKLSDGQRVILIIAGNHDNPERLSAISPLTYENGIIIVSSLTDVLPKGNFGKFKVIESGKGYFEIELKGERAIILTMPYPSEKRLNELFTEEKDEEIMQRCYSERIGKVFDELSSKFRKDTINIVASHLFVAGGEESGSERPIQLGGSFLVDVSHLPNNAQYIALGHLHKPQQIKSTVPIFYSGSPLQYSKSEVTQSKGAYIVDLKPGREAQVSQIFFKNYKPIEIFRCNGIDEAVLICNEYQDKDIWAYFEIRTKEPLPQSKIKEMKRILPDIIEIKPIFPDDEINIEEFEIENKSIDELFKEFYLKEKRFEPSQELIELFMKIIREEDEAHQS